MKFKTLVTSNNVDAIFINEKYQDETKQLELSENDIKYYQCQIELTTKNNDRIKILFHSFEELSEFAKAYDIK